MTVPASEHRRYLALAFPLFPADRWRIAQRRRAVTPADAPRAFVEKQRGAMRIVAVDARALALGIGAGLTLADARARVPDLVAIDHDLHADRLWLERIADGCERWTPMVALDPPDGLTLDITGCAHIFGGEAALAADVERRIAASGLHLRHAFAGTPEAAQALARFQTVPAADERAAVRRLPIAALRLEEEVETALRRAGLKTVGDLAARPTAPLAARFGEEMVAGLDRVLGRADSRITPRRAPPALLFERRFAEPIARTDDALAVIDELASEAMAALEERRGGGRRFAARLYRSDGAVRDLAVETGLPTRDPKIPARLFRERIDALADPIDPGFGFDLIRLAVPRIEPLTPSQLQLEGGSVTEDALAALVDRLSTRLGRGRIRRFRAVDTHIPEQRALALPAVAAAAPTAWDVPEPGEPPLRPLHLFDPPQPIEVMAEVPDGPPRRFRWRRTSHEVTRFEGPERIAAEWWKAAPAMLLIDEEDEDAESEMHPPKSRHTNAVSTAFLDRARTSARLERGEEQDAPTAPLRAATHPPKSRPGTPLTRDYFRVEDTRGRRFWLFRNGLYGSEASHPGWYIHGLFA